MDTNYTVYTPRLSQHRNKHLRQEFRSCCSINEWALPVAATLTLKQARTIPIGLDDWKSLGHSASGFVGEIHQSLDRQNCEQNFRHLINVLNVWTYGHAFRRYGKRLRVIPVIEGGNGERFHYHALIDCADRRRYFEFTNLIADTWRSTDWGYDQVCIRVQADDGWISYMTKFKDKEDFADSIDWMNFYNG